jgi:hypothetical protein
LGDDLAKKQAKLIEEDLILEFIPQIAMETMEDELER